MAPSQPDIIERYEIPVDDQTHRFTIGQGPLHYAYYTPNIVEFWACAPTDASSMVREFTVIGTGKPIPPGTWHVGTVLSPSGNVVWHVLENYAAPISGDVPGEPALQDEPDAEAAVQRVQELGDSPQCDDPTDPWTEDYLRGYRHAMNAVQRAIANPPTEDMPKPSVEVRSLTSPAEIGAEVNRILKRLRRRGI